MSFRISHDVSTLRGEYLLAAMLDMVAGFVVALTLPNADLDKETPVENQTEGKVTHSLD